MKNQGKWLVYGLVATLGWGCGPKKSEDEDRNSILAMAGNLQNVQLNYVPKSITDTGTSSTGVVAKPGDDICAGVDFIQCQPRLIRTNLLFGQAALGVTYQIVTSVAMNLAGVKDGTNGSIEDTKTGTTINFSKRALLDFDLLLIKNGVSVGFVSATPKKYTIQFDIGILDKDKPESRGGKLDIEVNYTDAANWTSQITAVDQKCMAIKPSDPQSGRIQVTRKNDLWSGQSMFYNGISAKFGSTVSCSDQPSDNTSLVSYTDLVADHSAAKASIYMFKRSETTTDHIQNFGIDKFCTNYSDYCQLLATSLNTTPSAVDTTLKQLINPYCVKAGSSTVEWNSNCSNYSQAVSAAPFYGNSNWLSPQQFSSLKIVLPEHL